MSRAEATRPLLLALVLVSAAADAQGVPPGSRQERERRELMRRLNISGGPPAADAGAPAPELAEPVAPTSPGKPRPAATARREASGTARDAWSILERRCKSCHRTGGSAGGTGWVMADDLAVAHAATLRFVNPRSPAASSLLRKAANEAMHLGGKLIATGSAEHAVLVRWISAGAARPGESSPEAPPVAQAPTKPTGQAPAQLPATAAPERATPAPAAEGVTPSPPLSATARSEPSQERDVFATEVHPRLLQSCGACHAPGKMAQGTRYLVDADVEVHRRGAQALLTPGSSSQSALYRKARGDAHAAGAIWPEGSADLQQLAGWIDGGALGAPAAAGAEVAEIVPPKAAPPSASSAAPAAQPHGGHGGVSLGSYPFLGTLQLNGRFDLNFERTGYNDHPFQPGATNAIRSYHHFLFLTRHSPDDPVTLSVELLTLQFWEVGATVSRRHWPVDLFLRAGRVLVPFGADPLYHQTHGGLTGVDQRVLPVFWAREGVRLNASTRWRGFTFSGDLYTVAGHRLRRADAVLNLQSDLAPLEDVRLALGARLGASWGPVSVWYSPYYNSLGFGRRLFMQALDLAIWRPRGVPILERFSLAAGLLRADVSGGGEQGYGGPGDDYYHFASYFQVRFYPLSWLYLQYRQGLRTFNNRRGLYVDLTDLARDDGSAHNVGVVARWRGLSAGLYHFWNLELADEVRDDFTRVMVTYEF